ncbi:MAG: hypothetical protein ABH969_00170 [Pseudomonadota bacterium]
MSKPKLSHFILLLISIVKIPLPKAKSKMAVSIFYEKLTKQMVEAVEILDLRTVAALTIEVVFQLLLVFLRCLAVYAPCPILASKPVRLLQQIQRDVPCIFSPTPGLPWRPPNEVLKAFSPKRVGNFKQYKEAFTKVE